MVNVSSRFRGAFLVAPLFVAVLAQSARAEGPPPPDSVSTAGVARAQGVSAPLAARLVNTYFHALGRQDAGALGAVTRGTAAADTRSLLQRIWSEAARRKVAVELKVKNLLIAPSSPVGDTTRVDVDFDVAVIARRWIFSKVTREWNGHATFLVGRDGSTASGGGPCIVGIHLPSGLDSLAAP